MFRWHYTDKGEYPKHDCEEVFCEAQNRGCAVLTYYKDHDAKKAGQFVDNNGTVWSGVYRWCKEKDVIDMLTEMSRFLDVYTQINNDGE